MLSRLREHIGGAGLIVAIVALVAALAGGAIAANGGSGDGKATASAKAKKGKPGPRGPKGPKGDTGPQGPQGPAGPAGAKGDTGAAGSNGTNGSNGAAGATGPTGVTGKDGKQGEPWTAGGTLPPGETETGTWAFGSITASAAPEPGFFEPGVIVPITFPIPLETGIEEGHAHFINLAGEEVEIFEEGLDYKVVKAPQAEPKPCPGTALAPEAAAGELCVYESKLTATAGAKPVMASQLIGKPGDIAPSPIAGEPKANAGTTGAILIVGYLEPPTDQSLGWGTWAVTAPE